MTATFWLGRSVMTVASFRETATLGRTRGRVRGKFESDRIKLWLSELFKDITKTTHTLSLV